MFGSRAITNNLGRGTQGGSYVSNIKGLGLLLSDKKTFEVFHYMGLCKTNDPQRGTIF